MQKLIDKLEKVLGFLDDNELAVPAIKVEEAIQILKDIEESAPESGAPDS
ncbi:hypothetical protein [Parasphingorhabdus sp.]